MANFLKLNLKIPNTLSGRGIILIDDDIKQILEEEFDYSNKKDELQSSLGLSAGIIPKLNERVGKVKLAECFSVGLKVETELLNELVKFLKDARLALYLFEQHTEIRNTVSDGDRAERRDIEGVPCREFDKIGDIYAHAFLHTIATVSFYIYIVDKNEKDLFSYIPEHTRSKISSLNKALKEQFPNIREIRNSWQHYEKRSRGLDRNNKPIPTKLIVSGCMTRNNLDYTIRDGSIASLEISEKTFREIEFYVQNVFDSFEWIVGFNEYTIE
jgi:hypothetical protein